MNILIRIISEYMCPPDTYTHPKISITIKQIYWSNSDNYFKKVMQLEYAKFLIFYFFFGGGGAFF